MDMKLVHTFYIIVIIVSVCDSQQPFNPRNNDPKDNWSSWRPPWGDTYHAT